MNMLALTDDEVQLERKRERTIPIVVLTGGPGGGKSTLMSELQQEDTECRRWVFVPEAAPLLFQTGLDGRVKSFQLAVLRVQMGLEDACTEAARPGQVLVCHRGTLDPLAYWLSNGWTENEFFACAESSREELLTRYAGIIHLQTAAIDAVAHYTRWPDAHRPESPEQAMQIDDLCACSWRGHDRYVLIGNSGRDWADKARIARNAVLQCLGSGKS